MTRYLIIGAVLSLVVGCGGPRYQTYNINRLNSSANYSVDEARCNLEAQKNVKRVIVSRGGSALDSIAATTAQSQFDNQYYAEVRYYQKNCMAAKGWTSEQRKISK